MNCMQASARIGAHVDGELAAPERHAVARHLDECGACAQEHSAQSLLRERVRREAAYHHAPAALRRAIAARGEAARPRRRALPRWLNLAAAIPRPAWGAAFALLLASNAWLALRTGAPHDDVARQLVNGHIRALVSEHPFDVASSDRHTVKPWFAGKVDYAPAVVDFAAEGFTLVGGRVDYIGAQPVATLVYRHDSHLVDVTLWPHASGGTATKRASLRGYAVRHWVARGMDYWIVADTDEREVDALQRLLERD